MAQFIKIQAVSCFQVFPRIWEKSAEKIVNVDSIKDISFAHSSDTDKRYICIETTHDKFYINEECYESLVSVLCPIEITETV